MSRRIVRSLRMSVPVIILVSGAALASDHHAFNGAWRLNPTRSEFNGQPTMQSGTLTIGYRDRNIYISHNYIFDGPDVTVSYRTSLDGRENSSIHQGKAFKTIAKWEGDELVVASRQGDLAFVEHYRLNPDGTLTLTTDRPDHVSVTLVFERQ